MVLKGQVVTEVVCFDPPGRTEIDAKITGNSIVWDVLIDTAIVRVILLAGLITIRKIPVLQINQNDFTLLF